MTTPNPTLSNGRYKVLSCIGKGGMAAVFLTFDTVLKTNRAIKVLHPEYMTRARIRQRFKTEAIAMAQLSHPNIVRVFDHGQEGLTSYIVMEYVPYGTLRNYLNTHGVLDAPQAVKVCLEIAQSLKEAHDKGIIHRDIKPDNILLDMKGAKLTDFGLARLNEQTSSNTHTQAVMGTFAFMSPEQRLSAKRITHQADIYSLSASLFSMLSKEDPSDLFDPSSQASLLSIIESEVADIISKGCQMDCAHRYQNIDSMIKDLMRVAESLPKPEDLNLIASESQTNVDLSELGRTWLYYTSDHPSGFETKEGVFVDSTEGRLENSYETFVIEGIEEEFEKNSSQDKVIEGHHYKKYLITLGLIFSVIALFSFFTLEKTEMGNSNLEFELFQPKTPEDELGFEKLIQVLLSGELSQAERLLTPYLERYPNEPAVHSVSATLYVLQRKNIASAVAADQAAFLSTERHEPLAEMIVLAARSWKEEAKFQVFQPQWSELREAANSPLVELVYLISIRLYQDPKLMMKEIAEAKIKYPKDVAFLLFETLYLQENNRTTELLELLEASIQAHPTVTNFQLERGIELYRQGRLEVAEDVLLQVLRQDSNLNQARLFLAGIYTQRNDEAQKNEQFFHALGDTATQSEQLFFLKHHGSQLANVGQLEDANKVWQFCVSLSSKAGMHSEATDCIVNAIFAQIMIGPVSGPEWDGLLLQLERQLLNPNRNDILGHFWSIVLQYAKGIAAVRNGQIDAALSHLRTISSLETRLRVYNRDDFFSSSLELELLISSEEGGTPEGYQTLLDSMLSVSNGDCFDVFRRAEVADKLNRDDEVGSLLSRIFKRECSEDLSNQGMINASALIWSAQRAISSGDVVKAQEKLDGFENTWAQADSNLGLVKTKDQIRIRISE